ncbi:MAG TPA: ATP-grasp domain-containing protein [Pirellulales bacterium]
MYLLILGASVRAAAQSAARAGFSPVCVDLFADADLRHAHPCQLARRYPRDLALIARQLPPMPWMFTGGLENWPSLVEQISQRHSLRGNPPETLRRVRDPFALADVLATHGIEFPACRPASDPPPRDGSWLLKHRRASGGQHVKVWNHAAPLPPISRSSAWYFQRRVVGVSCGAAFVAAEGKARLLGVTEQLLSGEADTPFRYAGSIGPLPLTASQESSLARLGEALAAAFGLRGLFGVDLMLDGDAVTPIEVNPRYTASLEVLERATGLRSLALHVQACEDGIPANPQPRKAATWCGKRVVYAKRTLVISPEQSAGWLSENAGLDWPPLADIPIAGTPLQAGQPLLTVLGEAGDRSSLLKLLTDRCRAVAMHP